MVSRAFRTGCDESRLGSYLDDLLSEGETARLADHLDRCESCREALERLAGGTRIFAELRGMSPQEGPPRTETVRGRKPDAAAAAGAGAEGLDFLGPPAAPGSVGRLGPYDVTGVLGRGGFGIVLKAVDPALGRTVAIKVLAPPLAVCPASRNRFAREAKAAAAVVHENVVAIHAVDAWNGLPYLVMPCVAGRSLQERVDHDGPLAAKEVLRVGMQAALGLAAAHDQGIVHRDVKPSNILLENGVERVKLSDFGLARAVDDASQTRSGVLAGTPQYMSPEQARGEPVDHRSDLFSLGSVLYFTCAGHPPFRADSTPAVLRRVSDDRPRPLREVNPEVPDWLAGVVDRLMAKDPAGRFATAAEVAGVLRRHLADLQRTGTSAPIAATTASAPVADPTPAATAPAPAPSPPRKRLGRVAVALSAVGLAGLVASAAGGGGPGRPFASFLALRDAAPDEPAAKDDKGKWTPIVGSGTSATKTWNVDGFTTVRIGSAFRASVKRGDAFGVVTTSDDNLAEYVRVAKDGTMLVVGMEPNRSYKPKEPLTVSVTLPAIEGLEAHDASMVVLDGFRSEKAFRLRLRDASRLGGSIEVGDAEFEVADASHLELRGKAAALRLRGRDASHVRLADFPAAECDARVSDASNVRVTVRGSKPFRAQLSDASNLEGEVDASDLGLKLSDSSHATLKGKAGQALLQASGASRISLTDFKVETAVVTLTDSSRAAVDATKALTYQLGEGTTLEYAGDPATVGTRAKSATLRPRH